jgi:enoyl-CoA hydratase
MALMKETLADHALWAANMEQARDLLMAVVDLDRPIIAKVNGAAVGLGATLALFCDIVVAGNTVKITDPHVGVGLSAGDGGALIWPELIGYARAKMHLLTGLPILGEEAARIGLVSEAVPSDRLDQRVDELAHMISLLPPVAVRLTKKSVNMSLRQKLDAMIEAHLGYETLSHLTDDHAEAVNALLAKRDPVFVGR